MAELFRPGLQGAIARDLIMLDGLGGCNQTSVERVTALELRHDLLAFRDDTLDGGAVLRARALADNLEHLFETLRLHPGLALMLLEGLLELRRLRRPSHL